MFAVIKNLIFAFGLILACPFGLLYAAETSASSGESGINEAEYWQTREPNFTKIAINKIAAAAQTGDYILIEKLISSQYLESGERLKKLIKQHGVSVDDFDKKILRDFNFYTIVGFGGIKMGKKVIIVETFIRYDNVFIKKYTEGGFQLASTDALWNNIGGNIFAKDALDSNGSPTATFYLVLQNNLWKLHEVRFTSRPMTNSELNTIVRSMETVAVPNTP